MRKKLLIFIAVILLVGSVSAQENPLPRFEDYPAAEKFNGNAAEVKTSGPKQARKFRTALWNSAKEGVDFAGRFIVATWGCGTDCRELAIIDARSGEVYFTPSLMTVTGELGQEEDRLQFRVDSSLLIVVGARNEEGQGRHFYQWNNNRLRLIRSVKK